MCAALREIFGGFATSVCQCPEHGALTISGARAMIGLGSVIKQCFNQLVLHTGEIRMNTRSNKTERRRSSAIHVRLGVNFGACFQQHFCDGDDILRSLLSIAFYTVCRDIVKQRCCMLTR